MPALTIGARGAEVERLQRNLIKLGYKLPRFGADGDLGEETLRAASLFARDRGTVEEPDALTSISERLVAAIEAAAAEHRDETLPPAFVDLRDEHDHSNPAILIGTRPWTGVTGITLHQTAVFMTETAKRWKTTHAHLGVMRDGRVFLLTPLNIAIVHGHGFNRGDVGIEINGQFEGIEEDPSTFWRPDPPASQSPQKPTPQQLDAVRAEVRWICDEVTRNGGAVRFIHAHRQSFSERIADPGSRVWQHVGLWAQSELGLSDGGIDPRTGRVVASGRTYKVGSGRPIPQAWDPRYEGNRYR